MSEKIHTVSAEQWQRLCEASEEMGIAPDELVRLCVDAHLEDMAEMEGDGEFDGLAA